MRTFFITGATRGIGRAIALAAAREGANVALLGKTVRPHRVLPGTLPEVAAEVRRAGGCPVELETDVRDDRQISAAVDATVREFGGIDVVVNNAGAISLTRTAETPVRIFDRMMSVNVRACWITSRAALPHLRGSANPHILNLAPPLSLDPKWLGPHVAYTISKYGMSLATLGLAEELREDGIAVNGLWPRTVIATAALRMIPGIDEGECRTEQIVADAALAIVRRPAREITGRLLLDEEILREDGVTDFSRYAIDPTRTLRPDLFLD